MLILCGDIGGTKTLIQLVEVCEGKTELLKSERYSSQDYDQFDLILESFLANLNNKINIASACFGVAGPVIKSNSAQTASITNLPWQMDTTELSTKFDLSRLALINDFEAIGYGIEALTTSDIVSLQSGQEVKHGNQLIIGAGTGLGVAQLIWNGHDYLVIPTEGGHTEFAPATEIQLQLAGFLLKQKGRNSIESVLSGSGLVNVFEFLCTLNGQLESDHHRSIIHAEDSAAAIAAAADEDQDSLAHQAMSLFAEIYGGQAGNFALSSLALGGVYVAGGIAAKILPYLRQGDFVAAFNAKGKMADLMRNIPVKVITNQEVGLIGSRVYAEKLAKTNSSSNQN